MFKSAPPPPPPKVGFFGNLTSSASQGSAAVRQATDTYGIMIVVGIIIAIVFFILAYLLYIYLAKKITNKIMIELPETILPRKGTVVHKIDGSYLPTQINGSRYTLMFWIYITDINMFAGEELRHVLHIGDEKLDSASPQVYLDGMTNKIYIRFAKDTDTDKSLTLARAIKRAKEYDYNAVGTAIDTEYKTLLGNNKITTDLDAIKVDLSTHGVIIEYVPLQRWVHVAIVVNETVNRGYITTYLDGEIVSSNTSDDTITLDNGKQLNINFTGLNLSKKGDLYIGGDIYNKHTPRGFSGLVSRVGVSNFDMNIREIKAKYLSGPVDNLSSKLGMPAYGVRNPIYKIGA